MGATGSWTTNWKEIKTPFLYLSCAQLDLAHGFAGVGSSAPRPKTEENFDSVIELLGVESLYHLRQVHDCNFVMIKENKLAVDQEALSEDRSRCFKNYDAFFIEKASAPKGVYLVKTADCAPIIISSKEYVAVIHAGWRGIVAGMVEKAVRLFESHKQTEMQAVIGPCANDCCYEVGAEVWRQFYQHAVRAQNGTLNTSKRTVSLKEEISHRFNSLSAQNRIDIQVLKSDVCTLCDSRFHSYRREGESRGTNISFVVL